MKNCNSWVVSITLRDGQVVKSLEYAESIWQAIDSIYSKMRDVYPYDVPRSSYTARPWNHVRAYAN